MLRLIVFVCGAALMALELVAARVLAPVLGNSIFVWGAVISIVMIALSLGYWLGGHLADRHDPSRLLALFIAAGGLFTVVAPVIARAVLPVVAPFDPRLGALIASALFISSRPTRSPLRTPAETNAFARRLQRAFSA